MTAKWTQQTVDAHLLSVPASVSAGCRLQSIAVDCDRLRLSIALLALCFLCAPLGVQAQSTDIPERSIDALDEALADSADTRSQARQRLAVRRLIREGETLLEKYPTAPNRFHVLGTLFKARRQLLDLDEARENREAFLVVCRQLVEAPDTYAEIRLEADLLLSQTELVRQGADLKARADALRILVERYRDTTVEPKVIRMAMLMAIEFGDIGLITDLREVIAERFAGDLDFIMFLRDHLAGQVFGAPFCGTFTRSDGKVVRFPMAQLGRTTVLYFWSKEDGKDNLERLATTWKEKRDEVSDRLAIVSFNLDDLPDAGEGILRELGVDWPALRLPGGRENPIYRAYVRGRADVKVTPTGYAALYMGRGGGGGKRDWSRWLGSSLARGWTKPRYTNQMQSIFTGEFLILDPRAPFDSALPPETRTTSAGDSGAGTGLARSADSVPEDKLGAIQACFVEPPLRYRTPPQEIHAAYERADALCREVIAAHPGAPDLWVVRNRRIIALLGLWKLTMNPEYFERAVGEARIALAAEPPPPADVVARFCLARAELGAADTNPETVIGNFLNAAGGAEKADARTLAAAAILALDAGDRMMHERYRRIILDKHAENPAIWQVTAFLLNRYHRYWLYRAPYTAGWSFDRRERYFLCRGEPEDARRVLHAELKTLEGDPFRIPEDTSGKWTVIFFMSQPGQGIPRRGTLPFAESRPFEDVKVIAAILDDDAARVGARLQEKPHDCMTVLVPGGLENPLVQKLGILAEDVRPYIVMLRPDGHIAAAVSWAGHGAIQNVIEWHDEKSVDDALDRGDLEKARHLAFTFAPLEEPSPQDRRKRRPPVSLAHLRSRAKVYMAMEEWDKALADLEKVATRQRGQGAGMSLDPPTLRETRRLLETVRKELELDDKKGAPKR